jgi:hypothetical protein
MPRYLPATQALDALCNYRPDQPYRNGLRKTLLGGGLLVLGGVSLAAPFIDLIPGVDTNVRGGIADKIADAGCIGLGVGSIGGAFYLLPDGLHSLIKPLRNIPKEGRLYAHNGGYTRRPSWADKKYGTRVIPVDNVVQLIDSRGHVFVNGFEVADTELQDGLGHVVTVDDSCNTPTMAYSVTLHGKLRGEKMQSHAWMKYPQIEFLIDTIQGFNRTLCLVGETKEKENIIRKDFFHKAFEE